MMKQSYSCVLLFIFNILIAGDRVSYGDVYLQNNSDWDLEISADLKDEWGNVTPTKWVIAPNGAEKLANLYWLSNIQFKVKSDDEASLEPWLRNTYPIIIGSRKELDDLIIYIKKSRFGNRWDINRRFVGSAKIEYGGAEGYQLKIETP